MKQRGFTLVKLMIGVIFVLVFLSIVAGGVSALSGNSTISFGINGTTESRCIEGYKFVLDQNGNSRQILDEFGKGVRCQLNPDPGKPGSFGSMK